MLQNSNDPEWRENLDSWKSRRRKMSEDVFRRQEEIKQFELEEQIAQLQQKKTKTFSEMVESRATRGRALSLCLISSPLEFQDWEYENKTHKNGSISYTDDSEENSTVNSEDEGVTFRGRLGKSSQSDSEINHRTNGDSHIEQNGSKLETKNSEFKKLSDLPSNSVQMKPKENSYVDSGLESISSSHRAGDTPDSGSDFSPDSNSSIDCDSPRTGVNILEEFTSKTSQISQGHEITVKILKEKSQDFGFTFLGGKDEGQVIIASVLEGSKAESSGIHLGDRIISIDGNDVSSKKHIEIVSMVQKGREKGEISLLLSRQDKSIESTNGFKTEEKHSVKPNESEAQNAKSYEKSIESENEMYVDDYEDLRRQSELLASSNKSEKTCTNTQEQPIGNKSSSSNKDAISLKPSLENSSAPKSKETISNGAVEEPNKNEQNSNSELNSENQKKNVVKVKRVRRKGVYALNVTSDPNQIPQEGISANSLFPLSPVTELPSPAEETKTMSSTLSSNNCTAASNSQNEAIAKEKSKEAEVKLPSPNIKENAKTSPIISKPVKFVPSNEVKTTSEKDEKKTESVNVPSSPTKNKEKDIVLENAQNEKPKTKKVKVKVKKGAALESASATSPNIKEGATNPVTDISTKTVTKESTKVSNNSQTDKQGKLTDGVQSVVSLQKEGNDAISTGATLTSATEPALPHNKTSDTVSKNTGNLSPKTLTKNEITSVNQFPNNISKNESAAGNQSSKIAVKKENATENHSSKMVSTIETVNENKPPKIITKNETTNEKQAPKIISQNETSGNQPLKTVSKKKIANENQPTKIATKNETMNGMQSPRIETKTGNQSPKIIISNETVNSNQSPKILTKNETVKDMQSPKILTKNETVTGIQSPNILPKNETVIGNQSPKIIAGIDIVKDNQSPKIITKNETVNRMQSPKIETVTSNQSPKIITSNETVNSNQSPKIITKNETGKDMQSPKIETVTGNQSPKIITSNETVNSNQSPKIITKNETGKDMQSPKIETVTGNQSPKIIAGNDIVKDKQSPKIIKKNKTVNGMQSPKIETVTGNQSPKIIASDETVNNNQSPKIITKNETMTGNQSPKIITSNETVKDNQSPKIITKKETVNGMQSPKIETVTGNQSPKIIIRKNETVNGMQSPKIITNIETVTDNQSPKIITKNETVNGMQSPKIITNIETVTGNQSPKIITKNETVNGMQSPKIITNIETVTGNQSPKIITSNQTVKGKQSPKIIKKNKSVNGMQSPKIETATGSQSPKIIASDETVKNNQSPKIITKIETVTGNQSPKIVTSNETVISNQSLKIITKNETVNSVQAQKNITTNDILNGMESPKIITSNETVNGNQSPKVSKNKIVIGNQSSNIITKDETVNGNQSPKVVTKNEIANTTSSVTVNNKQVEITKATPEEDKSKPVTVVRKRVKVKSKGNTTAQTPPDSPQEAKDAFTSASNSSDLSAKNIAKENQPKKEQSPASVTHVKQQAKSETTVPSQTRENGELSTGIATVSPVTKTTTMKDKNPEVPTSSNKNRKLTLKIDIRNDPTKITSTSPVSNKPPKTPPRTPQGEKSKPIFAQKKETAKPKEKGNLSPTTTITAIDKKESQKSPSATTPPCNSVNNITSVISDKKSETLNVSSGASAIKNDVTKSSVLLQDEKPKLPPAKKSKNRSKKKNTNSQKGNSPAKQNEDLKNSNDSLNIVFQSQPKNACSEIQPSSSVNKSETNSGKTAASTDLVPDVLPVEKVAEEMEKLILEQLEEEERAKELSSGMKTVVSSPEHMLTAPPRLAEPPKEKPPPPPSTNEGSQKDSSLKRVNSTKRIKKEIHKRRSNFLGIDNAEENISCNEPTIPPPPALEEILKAEMELDRQSRLKIENASTERLTLEEKEIMQKEREIIESLESEERQRQLINGIEDFKNNPSSPCDVVSEEDRIESLKNERKRIETERLLTEEQQQIHLLEEKQLREREEFIRKQEANKQAVPLSDPSLSMAAIAANNSKPALSSFPTEIQTNVSLSGANGGGKTSNSSTEISESKSSECDDKNKVAQKPAVPPKPLKKKEAIRKERERLRQEQEALQREREEHRRKLILEQEELMKHQKSHAPDAPAPRLGPLPPLVQPNFPPQLTSTMNASPNARESASFPSRSHHGAPNGVAGNMNAVELMGPPIVRQNRMPAPRKAVQNEAWGQQKMASVRKQNHDSLTENRYNQNHWLIQEAEMRRINELKERQRAGQLLCSQTHLAEDDVCSNPPRVPVIPPPPHNPHASYPVQEKVWNYGQSNMPLKKYPPPVVKEPLHTIYPRETVSQQPPSKPSRVTLMERQEQMLSVSGRKRCSHCNEELGRGAAMIIESLQLYYHIHCFQCCVCQAQLGNGSCGTDVRVRNNKLHCHNCYSNDEAGLKFSQV